MKLKYDIYIFDFDGTLVLSNDIKYETFFSVTEQFDNSREIISDIIKSNSELTRYQIFKKFVLKLPVKFRKNNLAKQLTEKYSSICEEKIVLAPEVPGAKIMLKKLRAFNKNIYVSSATPLKYLTRILESRNLNKLFDGIYGAPSIKNEHINQILSITKKTPHSTVYIGDSDMDRMSAKKCGCDFIGLENNQNRFKQKPKILIRDYINFFNHILD